MKMRSLVIVYRSVGYADYHSCMLCLSKKSCDHNPRDLEIYLSPDSDRSTSADKNTYIVEYSLSARVASSFQSELTRSELFRKYVWSHLFSQTQAKKIVIHIFLRTPSQYHLDYKFGYQSQLLVNQKIELENIMSCLSTLGGAFSSLGDQFLDCAKTAGKISLQQYKIAEKLGDPVTLMRCRLYLSISLIQCNKFRKARYIVSMVYNQMKSRPEEIQDKRVIAMCLGIWAKLKYHWSLEFNRKRILRMAVK